MKRNESRKRTLPIIHLFYMLFLAVLACSGVGHAGDLEFHTNPERGLAPRCTYNTAIDDLQYGFIPDLPNKNDCCQTHGASLSELGRLMWPCLCKDEYDSTYPTCQNRQPYRVISLSSTLSGFMDADDPLGEAAYVSKYPGADDLQGACLMEENQMGYNPIGIPMQNSDGSLTDNGLIYLYGMQKTFKQALDNGIKLQLFFNYNPGDIPRDFVLGCDSADPARPCSPATHEFFSEVFPKDYVKVVGHMETIREFLFNPDCPLDEAAALKDSNCLVQYTKADGTQYSLAKTNLASLVHSFGNSFVGAAGAEWHSSCWPDDWETGENADLNRKAVLDAIMEMVPGRKVLLRRPLIKNDYFDGIDDNGHDYTYFGVHGPPEATPTNDCDWYEDLEPVSQADLTDWTPLPEGGTLTIDWDYARNHLGYFNAAFMANGNERNTIPGPPYATNPNIACIDNASAQINTTDRQADSKYSDYHLYYNADAPWAGQDAEVGVFVSYDLGFNCTKEAYFVVEENADAWKTAMWDLGDEDGSTPAKPENVNCSENKHYGDFDQYGTPLDTRVTGNWDYYYDYLYDGGTSDTTWRQDFTTDYECRNVMYYYGDGNKDTGDIDQKQVYEFYTGTGKLADGHDGARGWPCKGGDEFCDNDLVCTKFVEEALGELAPESNYELAICIDRFQCVPGEVGTHDWMRHRTVTTLKGLTEGNYDKGVSPQWILSYLDAQVLGQDDWWPNVYGRIGYVLDVDYLGTRTYWAGVLMSFAVKNLGYAAPLYDRPIYIVLRLAERDPSERNIVYSHLTSWDAREFQPLCPAGSWLEGGGCDPEVDWNYHYRATRLATDDLQLPAGQYEIGIWMPDPDESLRANPNYAIRIYNEGDAELEWQVGDGSPCDLSECPSGVTWLRSFVSLPVPDAEDPEETPTPEYCSNGCIWADQCIPVGGKDTPPNCSTNEGFPPRKICTSCSCEAAGEAGFCEELGGL